MPVREKGRRSPGSPPARPFSRPQPPADRRQSAGLFPIASGFTAETDWLLEGSGFELSVPLRRATTSELSVPPAVNAVGARLPRKRQSVSAVGLRRVLRSCCPRLAPCAALFGPQR